MKGIKISSRYAKSLIDLAAEQQLLDVVFADMQVITDACKSSHALIVFLESPIIRNDKKRSILHEIFGKSISEITLRFLDIIVNKNREMYLPEVAESFISQYRKLKNIQSVEIVTAVPLDERLRAEVMAIVKKYTHAEVELREKVNPGIIGGYILTLEDKQDDTSIRTKINKLRRALKGKVYLN